MHILHIVKMTTILHKSCADVVHWRNNYHFAQILHIYCTLEEEVQSCANLAHILCIGERSTILCKSCTSIAHRQKKYNLAQFLHIYCSLGENLAHILCIGRESCTNLAHILHIREITIILCKSCAYIAHWGKKWNLAHILRIGRESFTNLAHILRIYTSNGQLANLAQNTISPF